MECGQLTAAGQILREVVAVAATASAYGVLGPLEQTFQTVGAAASAGAAAAAAASVQVVAVVVFVVVPDLLVDVLAVAGVVQRGVDADEEGGGHAVTENRKQDNNQSEDENALLQ